MHHLIQRLQREYRVFAIKGLWDLIVQLSKMSVFCFVQVPDGISVSKEARNAVSKAASVFVLYATSWYPFQPTNLGPHYSTA